MINNNLRWLQITKPPAPTGLSSSNGCKEGGANPAALFSPFRVPEKKQKKSNNTTKIAKKIDLRAEQGGKVRKERKVEKEGKIGGNKLV